MLVLCRFFFGVVLGVFSGFKLAIVLLRKRELVALLNNVVAVCVCLSLSHGATGKSAFCDCGISWVCSLTFCKCLCHGLKILRIYPQITFLKPFLHCELCKFVTILSNCLCLSVTSHIVDLINVVYLTACIFIRSR